MRIAIIGYGKMGRMIEGAALGRGHRIALVVDPFAEEGSSTSGAPVYKTLEQAERAGPGRADLAIEFTRPDTAVENIRSLTERKLPVVVGTTGWLDRLEEVREMVASAGTALLWASNFSLGVNLFYRIAAFAAKLADPFPEYDVGGWEVHHHKKADSPSGTAKTLVGQVLAAMTRKKRAVWETLSRPPAAEELHYSSLRLGAAPGQHSLFGDSPADTSEITHTARGREGFVSGALLGAEWLITPSETGEPRRGVFTMDNVLENIGMGAPQTGV
jgi:4-hydroxy-tetrahydrodipicolinate reductase